MGIFVTGATGYIGSAVVRELIDADHKVVGLTRSDKGAAVLKEAGAEVHHGALDDLESLRSGAAAADGVLHLAFKHDFSNFAGSLATDLRAVETMGAALDIPRSSVKTQELLNWQPVHPTLISDLEQAHYFNY